MADTILAARKVVDAAQEARGGVRKALAGKDPTGPELDALMRLVGALNDYEAKRAAMVDTARLDITQD